MAICVSEAYSVSERPIIYLAIKQSALYIIFFLGAGGGIVHFALKQNLACTGGMAPSETDLFPHSPHATRAAVSSGPPPPCSPNRDLHSMTAKRIAAAAPSPRGSRWRRRSLLGRQASRRRSVYRHSRPSAGPPNTRPSASAARTSPSSCRGAGPA